ncbi:hypothetical protein ACWC9R_14870 [Streptomyces sp. NPDC001219]
MGATDGGVRAVDGPVAGVETEAVAGVETEAEAEAEAEAEDAAENFLLLR